MKIDYWDDDLFKTFLGNKKAYLQVVFGFSDDSLEYHIADKYYRNDLFFVYKLNETYQYYGYHMDMLKYKQLLPHFDDLCSAELLNIKIIVPCDTVEYLNYMYGPIDNWKKPETKKFTWPYLNYPHAGEKWSNDKKKTACKIYTPQGNLSWYKPSPY